MPPKYVATTGDIRSPTCLNPRGRFPGAGSNTQSNNHNTQVRGGGGGGASQYSIAPLAAYGMTTIQTQNVLRTPSGSLSIAPPAATIQTQNQITQQRPSLPPPTTAASHGSHQTQNQSQSFGNNNSYGTVGTYKPFGAPIPTKRDREPPTDDGAAGLMSDLVGQLHTAAGHIEGADAGTIALRRRVVQTMKRQEALLDKVRGAMQGHQYL